MLQDVPQGDLKVSGLSNLSTTSFVHCDLGATFQIILHCIHHLLSIGLQLTINCSWSSRRHPSLADANESCLHGALLYSTHLDLFWSQQSFQFFNPHLHTITSFQVLFRSCDGCSFSRIPSSAFLFVTSLLPLKGGERIFCTSVGGVGCAFTCEHSYVLLWLGFFNAGDDAPSLP